MIGFVAIQGVPEFRFAEPWKSEEFGRASIDRGRQIYKEYCMQCHGATGRGDGPAASELESKAGHAREHGVRETAAGLCVQLNLYGGRSVGKSPAMPYWGLTIGQQGVADVMAYLNVTFNGVPEMAGAASSSVCVQPRKTVAAPAEYLQTNNPLPTTRRPWNPGRRLS